MRFFGGREGDLIEESAMLEIATSMLVVVQDPNQAVISILSAVLSAALSARLI
jgi:hypothetical protein